jgi:Rps23 Pro-64 3,4-dihydroxylase Tpa1-like proline 4-hydroxylase
MKTHTFAWQSEHPFKHLVIDDFFPPPLALQISQDFDKVKDFWVHYNNALEHKSTMNHWGAFPASIYKAMQHLVSPDFVQHLVHLTGCTLYADAGLHGAGMHRHISGGKLNPHLDYSIHPKLFLERRLNLIVYLTPDWHKDFGGHLGMWSEPSDLVKEVMPVFNRAVLFDTTNSLHGLSRPVQCPEDFARKSLAVYYLCEPRPQAEERYRALYSPEKGQENDPNVLELIALRSRV